jgi:hypothetical protein
MITSYNVVLTADASYIEGRRTGAIKDVTNLGELVTRVWHTNNLTESTVILDRDVALSLGIEKKLPGTENAIHNHPSLSLARDLGWRVKKLNPWMTFWHNDHPSIHIGLSQFFGSTPFPIWDTHDLATTSFDMGVFQRICGVPLRMTAGATAMAMLREGTNFRVTPYWKPDWSGIDIATRHSEIPYRWVSPVSEEMSWHHAYDINMQYLAAAQGAHLAIGELEYEETSQFDGTPGFWEITVPAWNDKRLPHPAGHHQPGDRVWVTAPTVHLLIEMSEYGVSAEPVIHASWTCKDKTGRILRTWAGTIRDGIKLATENRGAQSPFVRLMKGLYKEGIGMLANRRSRIVRYDWNFTIAALARANQFRRLWKIGMEEGRWPSSIDADKVWYPSRHSDASAAAPRALAIRTGLGGWKLAGTHSGVL